MKHGRVHNSEAIGQYPEGIPDYPSGSEDAFISCQTTKRIGLENIFSQPKGVVTYEVVGRRFVVISKHIFDLVILSFSFSSDSLYICASEANPVPPMSAQINV